MAARSRMTTDEFDGILENILDAMTGAEILAIPGAYELLAEALNSDVTSTWTQANPEKAPPHDEEEDECSNSPSASSP